MVFNIKRKRPDHIYVLQILGSDEMAQLRHKRTRRILLKCGYFISFVG